MYMMNVFTIISPIAENERNMKVDFFFSFFFLNFCPRERYEDQLLISFSSLIFDVIFNVLHNFICTFVM